MAIFSQGPNPVSRATSWNDALSPLGRTLAAKVKQTQDEEKNLSQGSMLQSVLRQIEEAGANGQDLPFEKIAGIIAGGQSQGLDPDRAEKLMKQYADYLPKKQAANSKNKEDNKVREKLQTLQTGLGTIQDMKKLIPFAGPSNYLSGLLPGDVQKKRAKLSQLGTSLIPLVSAGVPIRNQQEFNEYKKTITNPNSNQSELEGALEGIQSLISRQLSLYQSAGLDRSEGGGLPGSPEVLGRSQSEKPQQDFVSARNRKTGKMYRIPRDKYKPHPDLEETDQANQ